MNKENKKIRAKFYQQQQYIEIPQELDKQENDIPNFDIEVEQNSQINDVIIEVTKEEESDEEEEFEYSQEEFNEKHLYVALKVDVPFAKIQKVLDELSIDLTAYSKQEHYSIISFSMDDKKKFLKKIEEMRISFEIFTNPATSIIINNFDPQMMFPSVIFKKFGQYGLINRISFYKESKKARIWFLNQKSAQNASEMHGEKIGDFKIWIERSTETIAQREIILQSIPRNCDINMIKAYMIQIDVENPFENEKRISIIPDRRSKNNSGGAQALFTCRTAEIAQQIIQRFDDAQIQVEGVIGTIRAQIKK